MTQDQLTATGGRDVSAVRFPDGTPPAQVDVLVVGAGPVGLSSAIELAGRGVSVAVVDRGRTATLIRAGAMGHSSRTVEHFRRWGVLQQIRTEWTFPPEWNHGIKLITSLVGHELAPSRRRAFKGSGFTDKGPARHSLADRIRRPQTALQQAFLTHLGRHGVSVTGGWRLEALREDAEWIDAEVADVGTAQGPGAARSGGPDRLLGGHPHVADGQRDAERHAGGERGARVAVGGQGYRGPGVQQPARVRVGVPGAELGAGQQGRDQRGGHDRVQVGVGEIGAVVGGGRAGLRGDADAGPGSELVGVDAGAQAAGPARGQDRGGLAENPRVANRAAGDPDDIHVCLLQHTHGILCGENIA